MRGMTTTRTSPRYAAATLRDDHVRRTELVRFLPLWPAERADLSAEGRGRVIGLLAKALRHERRRGAAGHWAYDLARHAALLGIYKAEVRAQREQAMAAGGSGTNGEDHGFVPRGGLPPSFVRPHIANDIVPPSA